MAPALCHCLLFVANELPYLKQVSIVFHLHLQSYSFITVMLFPSYNLGLSYDSLPQCQTLSQNFTFHAYFTPKVNHIGFFSKFFYSVHVLTQTSVQAFLGVILFKAIYNFRNALIISDHIFIQVQLAFHSFL